MTELSQLRIDELCAVYEEFRSLDNSGPNSIRQFLEQAGSDAALDPSLLSELIQIDMQLSWMRWDKGLCSLVESLALADLRLSLETIPRIPDYTMFDLRSQSEKNLEALSQMAKCEMDSRDFWGDAIGPLHYKETLGLLLNQNPACRRISLKYTKDRPGTGLEEGWFTVRGKTLIGRQRSSDPSGLFEEELPDGKRIVIADRMDVTISREQLLVEVLSRNFAIITNLSSVNPVIVPNVGALEPGSSKVIQLDCYIRLPGVGLHITSQKP